MIEWREQPIELPLQHIENLRASLRSDDARRVEACCVEGLVIIVDSAVRGQVEAHLAASDDEQGGLLLGAVFTRGGSPVPAVVHVRASVAAADFSSSGVSLRMEPRVWTHAREALRERELIVGWYHSHPGLSAFFSDTDRRTQRGFFGHPFSVGWVRDPVQSHECWFVGADSMEVPPARVLTIPTGAERAA